MKQPVTGISHHAAKTAPTSLSEIILTGWLETGEVTDASKSMVMTLQYQEKGEWKDHLRISFQGGPVPETVAAFDADPNKVIATSSDIAVLKNKPLRLHSNVSKTLTAEFDITWQ